LGRNAATRVLVIGCGFIGERLVSDLVSAGHSTVVLTRSPPDARKLERIRGSELFIGDARTEHLLTRALDGVEHVVYSAGGLLPAESNLNPRLDLTLSFPPLIAVLDALKEREGVGLTLMSSGGTVYGRPRYLPVDELHPADPISSYGIVKLTCEKYVGMYSQLYGLPAQILRCSNVYGENQPAERGQGAIPTFLQRVRADKHIAVFGDGSIVRDYLYIGDLAAVVLRLLALPPESRLLNVGSGDGTSINDLIDLVGDITDKRVRIQPSESRSFDVQEVVLDISRLRSLMDIKPTAVEVGVRRTYAAMQDEPSASPAGPHFAD
jgi:UDP-glucose 4-epimerase